MKLYILNPTMKFRLTTRILLLLMVTTGLIFVYQSSSDHHIVQVIPKAIDQRTVAHIDQTINDSTRYREEPVTIVFIVDEKFIQGLPTTINAIWSSTNRSLEMYIIYVKTRPNDPPLELPCTLGNLAENNIHVISVNASKFLDHEVVGHMHRRVTKVYNGTGSNESYRGTGSNYLRFYIHRILPSHIKRIIYLDVDALVLDDIGKLWDLTAKNPSIISAVKRSSYKPYEELPGNGFNDDIENPEAIKKEYAIKYKNLTPALWARTRLNLKMRKRFLGYNNGILVIRIQRLRDEDDFFMRRLRLWTRADTIHRWFIMDTQYLFGYVYYDEAVEMPKTWNSPNYRTKTLEGVQILHYSGYDSKPWMFHTVNHHEVWDQYTLAVCSGNGNCNLSDTNFQCKCYQGYSGNVCQTSS